MSEDPIPNPVPSWMDTRFGPLRSEPANGRRPAGARRPPERHFPGFDAPQFDGPPPDDDAELPPEGEPAQRTPPSDEPPAPPAPQRSVEEIVHEAVEQALARYQAGELTIDQLRAERERLISLRPSLDEMLRELKQMKPDYWRERRAWVLAVRSLLHNRLHIINRQMGAITRVIEALNPPVESPADGAVAPLSPPPAAGVDSAPAPEAG